MKRIKLGIIGIANMGDGHAKNIKELIGTVSLMPEVEFI